MQREQRVRPSCLGSRLGGEWVKVRVRAGLGVEVRVRVRIRIGGETRVRGRVRVRGSVRAGASRLSCRVDSYS